MPAAAGAATAAPPALLEAAEPGCSYDDVVCSRGPFLGNGGACTDGDHSDDNTAVEGAAPRRRRRRKAKKPAASTLALESAAADILTEATSALASARNDAAAVMNSFSLERDMQGPAAGVDEDHNGLAAALESRDPDSEEEEADPERARLQHAFGQAAEQLPHEQPGLPLECALLKAVWSVEGDFSTSLVSRYQTLIADGIAPADDDVSEAQWWFQTQPEAWGFI